MNQENKIYVGNLEYSVTEEELQKTFDDRGLKTKSLKIIKDKYTGKSKGFGFVEMASDKDLQEAINSLDGCSLKGRKLRVSKAKKSRNREEGSISKFRR